MLPSSVFLKYNSDLTSSYPIQDIAMIYKKETYISNLCSLISETTGIILMNQDSKMKPLPIFAIKVIWTENHMSHFFHTDFTESYGFPWLQNFTWFVSACSIIIIMQNESHILHGLFIVAI